MMNFPHGFYKKHLKIETFFAEYLFNLVY